MSRVLEIEIPGTPQPQGSAKAFVIAGRARITSDNPRLRSWRHDAATAAKDALAGDEQFIAPVRLVVTFELTRPAGHFGSGRNAGQVRKSAPPRPGVKPDLDKLVRAAMDAITAAGVWRDDALVVEVNAAKVYAEKPRTYLLIEEAA